MGMLGARFPEAQFVVTGVLGPQSNAHGPNEFLDLPTARRVTAVLALVLDAAATRQDRTAAVSAITRVTGEVHVHADLRHRRRCCAAARPS